MTSQNNVNLWWLSSTSYEDCRIASKPEADTQLSTQIASAKLSSCPPSIRSIGPSSTSLSTEGTTTSLLPYPGISINCERNPKQKISWHNRLPTVACSPCAEDTTISPKIEKPNKTTSDVWSNNEINSKSNRQGSKSRRPRVRRRWSLCSNR